MNKVVKLEGQQKVSKTILLKDTDAEGIKMISSDEIHYESKGLLDLKSEYEILGKKLNRFLDYVEKNWNENL